MSIQSLSHTRWQQRNVSIIPTLVIGAGGTGDKVVRLFKRRIRLEWDADARDIPDLVQLLAIDTVGFSNRPDQEMLRPDEYRFLGGFDPQHVIDRNPAVREWWGSFPSAMLPAGIIHLGARQIRALGRVALFYAFPDVWEAMRRKVDILTNISAESQALRSGFSVPVEKSARQVFIVSSLCGGTGAGIFLDLATRLRSYTSNQVSIYGIFVLPSVFLHTMPSERQVRRIKANAYAALKELDACWYTPQNFRVRYPGEKHPTTVNNAIFDSVFLIGREGRGKSLTDLSDVVQQIAHFIYLATMHNLAEPLGEMSVNLDRTQKYYSSFAVGAMTLPETKLNDSVIADLKRRYLLNIIEDNRHEIERQRLERDTNEFINSISKRAADLTTNLIGETIAEEEYTKEALKYQAEIVKSTVEWIFVGVLPKYGIHGITAVYDLCQNKYENLSGDISYFKKEIEFQKGEIDKALRKSRRTQILNRLGRFGKLLDLLLPGKTVEKYQEDIEKAESEIQNSEQELAVTRLLAPEPDDQLGSKRMFTFVIDTLKAMSEQISHFTREAQKLANSLETECEQAQERSANTASIRGNGREALYYDMEIDPTLPGEAQAMTALFRKIFSLDVLQERIRAERTLQPEVDKARLTLKPPAAVQLMGFSPRTGSSRVQGRILPVADITDLLESNHRIKCVSLQLWELDVMLDTLVEQLVLENVRNHANLINFFLTPEQQSVQIQSEMLAGLRTMIGHLMRNVRAFWGATPFPDEQQIERFRLLSLPRDPMKQPLLRELFKEHIDQHTQYVQGSNPFRLDVLELEHAALLNHIQEVGDCRKAYDTFANPQELHINAAYNSFPDVVVKP